MLFKKTTAVGRGVFFVMGFAWNPARRPQQIPRFCVTFAFRTAPSLCAGYKSTFTLAFQYLTYGASVSADSVKRLLEHQLAQAHIARPTPVCIWGLHGIGKTELVRGLAAERNIELTYIAPAQFEEMGDLVGMPVLETDSRGRTVTRFAPPAWAPTLDGPGILLLDDFNRADDRILRGLMQLLQYYELVSWALPPKWLIVLTANPDGGDYSVTALDDAMLTRMLHVSMNFDVHAWARWAEQAGVDSRGIHFVLAYPELLNGRRTTPRSLVQFFNAIAPFERLEDHLPVLKMLGEATLDAETVEAFLQFVHLKLDRLPGPAEVLGTNDFDLLEQRVRRLVRDGDTQRMDMLSVLVSRINNYLLGRQDALSEAEMQNLQRFILWDELPNDLRLAMAQELTRTQRPEYLALYRVPEIGRLLLEKM